MKEIKCIYRLVILIKNCYNQLKSFVIEKKVGISLIHIGICDDEPLFINNLKKLIKQYAIETSYDIKITEYYDGLELIEKYDSSLDLIFLDIRMKIIDGLSAAQRIRQKDAKVSIIFLTTLTQYALEGYQYQATNYIIKPLKYIRLKTELERWRYSHQKEKNTFIIVQNDTGQYKIFLENLSYVESFNRNLLFHSQQENIICYKSMKEIEAELGDKEFVRCHTSYLVNLQYIKGVHKLEIQLITGEILPISQPRRKEFMEQLSNYWGRRI